MTAKPFDTSSPRDDLRDHPTARLHYPEGRGFERSLQQCDGTGLLQWHIRRAVSWVPSGPMFAIR